MLAYRKKMLLRSVFADVGVSARGARRANPTASAKAQSSTFVEYIHIIDYVFELFGPIPLRK